MTTVGDLFAGGGGVTEGAKRAGMQVVFAANHWPLAVQLHKHHHPDVLTVCQDLCQFDFAQMPDVDILWASPSCQGHSGAARPSRHEQLIAQAHDAMRASAWAVVAAVLAKRPRKFVVENVVQFQEWAPAPVVVGEYTRRVDAERELSRVEGQLQPGERARLAKTKAGVWRLLRHFRKGILFNHWLRTFELAGYTVTKQVLTASRWASAPGAGDAVPQRRSRLILVGHLGAPIQLRDPTTPEPVLEPSMQVGRGPWVPISTMTKPKARARAQAAQDRFGGEASWGYHVSHPGAWARSLQEPSTTFTCQNQHYLVYRGNYRLWLVQEAAAVMGFARTYFDHTGRTDAIIMAGNAVPPPMAAGILRAVEAA